MLYLFKLIDFVSYTKFTLNERLLGRVRLQLVSTKDFNHDALNKMPINLVSCHYLILTDQSSQAVVCVFT